MPRRTPDATRDYLKQVPLPQHATSYTVIEHETVIVNALAQLKLRGFSVESEHYRANNSGDVAVGVYHLKYKNDPELGMMFAWANSYDKTMRFKCAVGGFVRVSKSSLIGEDFSWSRKHTGTADQEMIAQVTGQILNSQTYYDNLLLVKEEMKSITVPKDGICKFLGIAFFQKGLFSKEQIGIVRDEILKPSFTYDSNPESLWTYYNHMLVALKRAHPRTWMEEHRDIHKLVCTEFMIASQIVQNTVASLGPVVTTTNHVGPPVVINITPNPGPVSIYSEQEQEKPTEKKHIEEFAEELLDKVIEENKKQLDQMAEDLMIKGEAKIHVSTKPDEPLVARLPVVGTPFLEDISAEDQKLIDERMARLFGTKVESIDLNLPD
jgi:hypothetical protein